MAQELRFVVEAVNNAKGTLDKVARDVDDLGANAERSGSKLGGMGKALGGVATVAGGFVVAQGLIALPGLLSGAASAAAEDEAATMRMNKSLELLAARSDDAGTSLQDMKSDMDARIAAGQKLAFSDDDIRNSMQKLIAATDDYGEAGRRQALAMDLARGAGIPLADASKLLGKINEENVEVFKRMGITLGENATETDALAAVQAKFGGQAVEFAASTAGGWEQSKIRLAELAEGFGTLLLPALNALVSFGNAVLLPFFEKIPVVVAAMAAKFRPLFDEHIRPAFERFQVYYNENLKPALDNIATGVRVLLDAIVVAFNTLMPIIGPIFDQLSLVVQTALGVIREVVEIVISLLAGDFSGAWENLKQLVQIVWDGIVGTVRNAIGLIAGLATLIFAAGVSLGESLFEGLKQGISAVGALATDIAQAVGTAIKRFINDNVIAKINRAVEFSISIPNPFGDSVRIPINPPDIPFLAQGGIVTRPTLAMIGESGPEAVVPLGRGGGVGATYYITVNALDSRGVADAVLEAVQTLESTGRISAGVIAA